MPSTKKMTIAALLAVTVSVAGCNSKKASSTDSGTAATTAAGAPGPAASAADSGASAPAATGAGAAASGGCPLTAAQVTAVMGSTYLAPQNTNGFCFYQGEDSLSIHVEDVSDLHTFDAELASAKESQQTDKTPTTVPGVGDKAAGVGQQLVVATGSKIIDIRDADTGGTAWPKSIALAKLVIAGLH